MYVTSADGEEDIKVEQLMTSQYKFEGMTAGTEYHVRVVTRGQQGGRFSEASEVAQVNTGAYEYDYYFVVKFPNFEFYF